MHAKVIMIASGKGGTGKSTVSVLLGARLAAAGHSVLLLELDAGLRSVDVICGVSESTVYDMGDLLENRCEPEKAISESPVYPGLKVVCAPLEANDISGEKLRTLCNTLRDNYEFILLDTAAGVGSPFRAALTAADQCILVLQAEPVSLRDGRFVSDIVYNAGIKDIRLVLNRVTKDIFRRGAVKDLDECIDTVCAQLLAIIPESTELQLAEAKSQPLPNDCLAFDAADRMAHRLLGERIEAAVK